jgi:hypothetical protein
MQTHAFEIFADYHQLYLTDDEVQAFMPEVVTDDDIERRLAAAPHIIVVHTERNMDVPVTVQIHESEPSLDLAAWDHVAECSLDVPSGRIVIAGCTDYLPEASRFAVAPGSYRARVCYGGFDTLSADGLDGDDHYVIQLWQAPPADLRVVKQYGVPDR